MPQHILIGLNGPKRSGKSTVVEVASELGVRSISISTPIKNSAHALVGSEFPDDLKDEPTDLLSGRTPRDLYRHIGALISFVPHLWVDRAWAAQYKGTGNYIVDSVGTTDQWQRLKALASEQGMHAVLVQVLRVGTEVAHAVREDVHDGGELSLVNDAKRVEEFKQLARRHLMLILGG